MSVVAALIESNSELAVSIVEASLDYNVADLICSLPIYWHGGND